MKSPAHYPKNHGQDLTDFFVKHDMSVSDLTDLLATAVTVEPEKEPERDPGLDRFFKGRKFMPARMAEAIMEDISICSDPLTGLTYRWNGKFWEQYDLQHIRSKALRMLGEEGTSSKAADIAGMVRDLSVLPVGRKMNDLADFVCLQNGMFNLQTGELLAHSKDYYSTHCLGVSFDPANIQACERFKKFLSDSVQDEASIRELQKFFGYCLIRETRYEKMLLLYGPGGDGKSTLMNVLRQLVGEENCSHIPMGRLDDQFYLSRLVDKLLNMSTEVESKAMQSQEIKAIVSGDPIAASFKNQTPFDFVPVCKLVYSTNKLPRMLDNSDGFFRKVMIIEMKAQFVKAGKADIFLYDDLLKELPGIFAWSLQGLIELRQKGFNPSQAMEQSLHDYKRLNNNVLYYIESHVQEDSTSKTAKEDVWIDYNRRCKAANLSPVGKANFQKEFLRLLSDLSIPIRDGKVKDPLDEHRRKNAYDGLKLIEEKLEAEISPDEGYSNPSPAPLPLEPSS